MYDTTKQSLAVSHGNATQSLQVLASHGFLHEASSCWTDWTSPRVDDWDPFSHAPYNALDLSDAGSCETDQLVHEDVSDAARGHGAILSHPAILDRQNDTFEHVHYNCAFASYTKAVTLIWELDCQQNHCEAEYKSMPVKYACCLCRISPAGLAAICESKRSGQCPGS